MSEAQPTQFFQETSLAKPSERTYFKKPQQRSIANLVISRNLISEAKRTQLFQKITLAKQKRTGLYQNQAIAKRNNLVFLKFNKIEAKRSCAKVILYLKKRIKQTFAIFKNESQKPKGFDSKLAKFCHSQPGHSPPSKLSRTPSRANP